MVVAGEADSDAAETVQAIAGQAAVEFEAASVVVTSEKVDDVEPRAEAENVAEFE